MCITSTSRGRRSRQALSVSADGGRATDRGRRLRAHPVGARRGGAARVGLVVLALTSGALAAPTTPVAAEAEAPASSPGLSYTGTGCVEPVALVFMPRAALQLALPPPFTVRDFAPGVALVVVAVASCQSISVAGKAVGPGSFSDIGVMIESPDGSGGDHLYQLWQISDQQDLVRLMSTVGMATERAEISFEKTPTSATASARSTLSGQYDLTVFTAPPENGTGSGSNTWWHAGPHGVVRVRNAGDKVAFNPGNFVLNLAPGSPLARMLGTTTLTGLGAIVYHGEHRGQLSVEQL